MLQSSEDPLRPDALAALADEPEALETRFRAAPEAFAAAIPGALARRPGHPVLRAWTARLAADGRPAPEETLLEAPAEVGPFAAPPAGRRRRVPLPPRLRVRLRPRRCAPPGDPV